VSTDCRLEAATAADIFSPSSLCQHAHRVPYEQTAKGQYGIGVLGDDVARRDMQHPYRVAVTAGHCQRSSHATLVVFASVLVLACGERQRETVSRLKKQQQVRGERDVW
jgi:hypothetical protein